MKKEEDPLKELQDYENFQLDDDYFQLDI